MTRGEDYCRHCNRRKAKADAVLGLCFVCYGAPEIRVDYQEVPLERLQEKEPPLAKEPTDALPGTPEKIRVMSERITRGKAAFHPGDAAEWQVGF